MTNIGILTTLNDELAPFLIKKINKLKNVNFFLIISKTKKNYKLKFSKIFKERTGDYFLKYNLDLSNSNIRLPTYLVNSHNCKEFHKLIKKKNIKFLNDYLENKIFSIDPFVSIDEGVSDLVEIAVTKGNTFRITSVLSTYP